MNRLVKFVVEHTWQAWALVAATSALIALLTGVVTHTAHVQERLSQLQIQAERHSIVLMSQTMNIRATVFADSS